MPPKKNTPDYLLLDHTADLRLEVKGSNPVDLFEKAGRALVHIMLDPIPSNGRDIKKISLFGDDFSDLIVRWLTEILYLFEGEHLVTTDINIDSLSSTTINATLKTLPFDPMQYDILREIKAVTYHQIDVTQKDGVWKARVILDL